jgi:iron complex transport system ATP-binding protein
MKLMDMAREMAERGKAVVLVLHDISLALRVADQMIVLKNGEIKGCGTSQQIFESGVLNDVFGLTIKRVQTEDGWQYYFTSGDR